MGLGKWQGREVWPQEVNWLRTVKEMKVLGFVVCPQYSATLQRTWDTVFRGVQRILFSWGSRALGTLQQRVNVLQTFALSKIWYAAQVLPLPPQMVKKIESTASTFIFRGRHEKLKLAELENSHGGGGLGLVCVATKAECLLLRQSLRILQRVAGSSRRHLSHWLGFLLQEPFPDLMNLGPVCQALIPRFPLHKAMFEALQEGLLRNEYDPTALETATSKMIYLSRAVDIISPPKVEEKYPWVNFQELVYPRLSNTVLEAEPRDALFCMVHNLHPTKERLFQQGKGTILFSPSVPVQTAGQGAPVQLLLLGEPGLAVDWLLHFLPNTVGAVGTTSEDFLLLQYPKDTMDKEVVWIIGNYCDIVLKVVIAKKRRLTAEKIAGLMRSRLNLLKNRAVVQPNIFW